VDGEKHDAKKGIIIATGSVPVDLPFLPVDETRVVTSTGALALSKVPERLVVIGGGVIGLEMASVWSRLGSKVTVIEFIDQVAGATADADVAKETQKLLKKQGIEFHLKRKCTSADIPDDVNAPVTLHTEAAAGGSPKSFEADVVLVSVGRRPFTDNLGLESAGVELNERKQVTINESYETTAKGVYAIGDVVRGPMLAHKAEEEGVAAVEIISTGSGHVNLDAIPSVIYTDPEVAWVGKTEQELKAEGIKYKAGKFPMLANSRARANGTTDGFVKLLADAETDRLLGAHIVATNAGELIQELVLAIEHEACSEDIARTSHAHPTLSEAILEAAHMTYSGKAIHF
jgi:dihydrolipoamide dehydrogenase